MSKKVIGVRHEEISHLNRKPCPVCGKTDHLHAVITEYEDSHTVRVTCPACRFFGPVVSVSEPAKNSNQEGALKLAAEVKEAVNLWNTTDLTDMVEEQQE